VTRRVQAEAQLHDAEGEAFSEALRGRKAAFAAEGRQTPAIANPAQRPP
jgi:hypothetical protein